MESQAVKLNVERRMALLQKKEIENRKKILEEVLLMDSGGSVVWTKHNHIITVIETWRIVNVE
jgi:hypothetical protein